MKTTESSINYPFDNAAPQAGARLASLSARYAPVTFRHLDRFGIREGACCLEVGAGGGSVAAFMKQRAGPGAHVIATDINTDRMGESMSSGVEIRRHDIGVDRLGASLSETGLVSTAELCRYRVLLDEPELFYPASMALIPVCGRRELA